MSVFSELSFVLFSNYHNDFATIILKVKMEEVQLCYKERRKYVSRTFQGLLRHIIMSQIRDARISKVTTISFNLSNDLPTFR